MNRDTPPSNGEVAEALLEAAAVLVRAGGDRWRVPALRSAAHTVRTLDRPVAEIIARSGRRGLMELPAIGRGIARRIEAMFVSAGQLDPQLRLFSAMPRSQRDACPIPSERAPEDAWTSSSSVGVVEAPEPCDPEPSVEQLVRVDGAFRARATKFLEADRGRGEWLPAWRVDRWGWSFRVRFSESRAAQRLGKTGDWVVIDWSGQGGDGQSTLVTEYQGPLSGRRVVRGRERGSLRYWATRTADEARRSRWQRTG